MARIAGPPALQHLLRAGEGLARTAIYSERSRSLEGRPEAGYLLLATT